MKTQLLIYCLTLLFLSSCSSVSRLSQEDSIPRSFAILQGLTTNNTAQINILLPSKVRIDVGEDEKAVSYNYKLKVLDLNKKEVPGLAVYHTDFTWKNALWKVSRLQITGLKKSSRYIMTIVDEVGELVDEREFKTLDLSKKEISFIVSSCMSDSLRYQARQKKLWKQVEKEAQDVDYLVLNGDNVYVDSYEVYGKGGGPKTSLEIWNRYVDHFRSVELFRLRRLVPSLSTWDDHDYGANNGNKHWPLKKESQKIFKIFFGAPARDHIMEQSVGVARAFTGFGHDLLFLDNRSFRHKEGSENKYAHFGKEQEAWMVRKLSDAGPTFVFNGGQFFGGYSAKESYETDHPESFSHWINTIKSKTSAPFVLVSGDLHFTETMKIEREQFGFDTYELTASSWHSRFRDPWSKKYGSNPRRISEFTSGGFNFLKIHSKKLTGGSFMMDVENYQEGKSRPVWNYRTLLTR